VIRALTLLSALVAVALIAYSAATHWLAWRFGMGTWPVPQGTGWPYQLESGFVPALTVLSLLGAILGSWHLHNCHHSGCWRIGKHKISGTPWCSRHEAEGRVYAQEEVTLAHIAERLDKVIEALQALASGPGPQEMAVTAVGEPVPGLWDWLRDEIRRRGGGGAGSVQRALGQTWPRGSS
jgi:hypothetical protein